jgi:hypothetical protein
VRRGLTGQIRFLIFESENELRLLQSGNALRAINLSHR